MVLVVVEEEVGGGGGGGGGGVDSIVPLAAGRSTPPVREASMASVSFAPKMLGDTTKSSGP